mgnify:CR=1 FL=1
MLIISSTVSSKLSTCEISNNEIVSDFKCFAKITTENEIYEGEFLNGKRDGEGILNYTPSYNKLIINFDLEKITSSKIMNFLKAVDFSKLNISQDSKKWTIPICYDFEMDLENMSTSLKINKDEIINIHLNTEFFVYMVGFIPGHPFMGDLNSKLFLNRLKTPRVRIPPGSVGIVEKFCNIYPYESPGGWNIIGRTPIKLFNKQNESNPCLLSPGDTVKFKSISKQEFEKLKNE